MVHGTVRVERLVSTKCGMRRILKEPQHSVQDYIRHAVRSGIYKVDVERNDRGGRDRGRGGPPPIAYPVEYEILSMNPAIPMPAQIPKSYEQKVRRHQNKQKQKQKTKTKNSNPIQLPYHLPTEDLIHSYLKRYDERVERSHSMTATDEEEAYMANILGISNHPTKSADGTKQSFTAMGRKNTVLSNAYQFALKQYEVLQDNKDMTEEESVKIVEELLQQQDTQERQQTRQRTKSIQQWRQQTTTNTINNNNTDDVTIDKDSKDKDSKEEEEEEESDTSSPPVSSVPSVLFNKPRTIQAMRIWAQRLNAVPYDQWTVGAATALDHWIAVDVLGMTESTWNALLDHHDETSNTDHYPHNISRTRDIVSVRQALFPETILFASTTTPQDLDSLYHNNHESASSSEEDMELRKDDDELDATERSIDELLASLGGAIDDYHHDDSDATTEKEEQQDGDAMLAQMVDQLQDWRQKNLDLPFDSWSSDTKNEFNTWLNRYVEALASDVDKLEQVDMDATREALLSEPPTTRDQSNQFWKQLQDESEAEIFLQHLLASNNNNNNNNNASNTPSEEAFAAFLELPYDVQLRKLVDMGTLRPILDEYTSDTDRAAFVQRYGETLMEGVQVEHLVPDPNGPITGNDLLETSSVVVNTKHISKDDRFRIQLLEHGTDEYGTPRSERARALYRAWNTMKSGRARYEELLFKSGKLDLRATTTNKNNNQDE